MWTCKTLKMQRNGHVMEIEMSTCETLKYKQMENVKVKLQSGNVNVKIWNVEMQRNQNVNAKPQSGNVN